MGIDARNWNRPALLLLVVPLLLAADGEQWRTVAKNDIEFAQALTADQVKYGPSFTGLLGGVVTDCEVDEDALSGREANVQRQILLYRDKLCRPWRDAWAEALAPCAHSPAADWCGDPKARAEHLRFDSYFSNFAAAFRNSTSSFESFNLMAVLASRLDTREVRDFPTANLDRWVATVLASYLRGAKANDAIATGKDLCALMTFGEDSLVTKQLRSYGTTTPDLSDPQRKSIEAIAEACSGKPAS